MASSIGDWRFFVRVMGIFYGASSILAVIGMYGVISYSVTSAHEIGVRMALGAQKADVLGMVTKLGLKLTCIGVGHLNAEAAEAGMKNKGNSEGPDLTG